MTPSDDFLDAYLRRIFQRWKRERQSYPNTPPPQPAVIELTSVDALMGFIQDHHQPDLGDPLPLGVVRLLEDLQALCDMCGVDFERAVRSARTRHARSKNSPQDS